MVYSKQFEACMAAERIIDMVRSAGFDITDPYSIINTGYMTAPEDMYWDNGASRLVIWDDYNDFVIKIALCADYEKYNQHEVEVYESAVKNGFADKFAWCYCYQEPIETEDCYVPGIYVMEFACCDEDSVSDGAWMSGYRNYCEQNGYDSSNYEHADEYNEWSDGDEYVILDYVIDSVEEERRYDLQRFIASWWITDVHDANVGFIGDNLVMVDYAGWNW